MYISSTPAPVDTLETTSNVKDIMSRVLFERIMKKVAELRESIVHVGETTSHMNDCTQLLELVDKINTTIMDTIKRSETFDKNCKILEDTINDMDNMVSELEHKEEVEEVSVKKSWWQWGK
jgi:hypothetical protein